MPLPAAAVASGEVREPEAISEALRELWRVGKFHKRDVVLGVSNQRVVVREVSLPWLPEKEFRSSLPFQVQEHVPIPVEEAVLDPGQLGQRTHCARSLHLKCVPHRAGQIRYEHRPEGR